MADIELTADLGGKKVVLYPGDEILLMVREFTVGDVTLKPDSPVRVTIKLIYKKQE
jgi:hypothetical protein